VHLEALPLTPNGKLDRGALPNPLASGMGREFVPPDTPLEAMLTSVWSQVLRLERIGVHDNFFEIGGHSLLAIGVITRICEEIDLELPVRALFDAPTPRELARYIITELQRVVEGDMAALQESEI
jgi:hypothetical protein